MTPTLFATISTILMFTVLGMLIGFGLGYRYAMHTTLKNVPKLVKQLETLIAIKSHVINDADMDRENFESDEDFEKAQF